MRRFLFALLFVSVSAAALTGCGNKGPLVRAPAATAPPTTAPAPAPAASAATPVDDNSPR